jgi:hypothetical protein
MVSIKQNISQKVNCNYEKKNICQFPLLSSPGNEVEVKVDDEIQDLSSPSTIIRKWYILTCTTFSNKKKC